MSETPRLSLPLLMPSQAQKHVTVNEALLRLDALSQLLLRSRNVAVPPAAPAEGDCYAVPVGASGAWSGRIGQVAIRAGGGWDFVTPGLGWRAYIEDEGGLFLNDGGWTALQAGGGGTLNGPRFRTIHHEHQMTAGATSATIAIIPPFASVWGITGLVTQAIGGATSLQVGVAGSANRYGSGIGTGQGSWFRGMTSSPLTYWEDTPVLLTAQGGSFTGTGRVRFLVYAVELPLPD